MIFINNNPDYIDQIATEWCDKLRDFLTSPRTCYIVIKIPGSNQKSRVYYESYIDKVFARIKLSRLKEAEKTFCAKYVKNFRANLFSYVCAKEDALRIIKDDYQANVEIKLAVHNLISDLFIDLYEDFTKEYANYFFRKLNIRTCPYCNRNYTFTIHDNRKETRPEFDHFYNKSTTPILAVSFYNLVPSCHLCNHIKHSDSLLVNPYFHGFDGKFRISNDGSFLGFDSVSDAEIQDIHTLGLDLLYKQHDDYVQELFDKVQAYNEHAREALVSSFQGAGDSPDRVFEFVWGKNLETAKQINSPLSKLTRDILEQVGIINEDDMD